MSIAVSEYAELGVAMSATDALAILEHRKEIDAQVLELIHDIPQTPPADIPHRAPLSFETRADLPARAPYRCHESWNRRWR